ncbi:TetR/AcrR family transcriptional regulator [Candidatus Bipolaricaulota bacterium]|nr:TetR/AcrR family transcriptional regulator [Candidatus Bipolaricaulota bacterium]
MRTNARSIHKEPSALETRLLRTATRVFAQRGFYGAGIRDVARAARVSIGTVYHYFRSKEAILERILGEEMARRRGFLEDLRRHGASLEAQIRAIAEDHFALIRERKHLARLLLREWLDPTPGLRVNLQKIHDEIAECLAQIIRDGIAVGQIQSRDPVLVAHAMLGAMEAVSLRVLAAGKGALCPVDKAAEELSTFLWTGLCQPSS